MLQRLIQRRRKLRSFPGGAGRTGAGLFEPRLGLRLALLLRVPAEEVVAAGRMRSSGSPPTTPNPPIIPPAGGRMRCHLQRDQHSVLDVEGVAEGLV